MVALAACLVIASRPLQISAWASQGGELCRTIWMLKLLARLPSESRCDIYLTHESASRSYWQRNHGCQFSCRGGYHTQALARNRRIPDSAEAIGGQETIYILRWTAIRDGVAPLWPSVGLHNQGHHTQILVDERSLCTETLRLGHPRPAHRVRD